MMSQDRLLVAIDTAELDGAVRLARSLAGSAGGLKLGLEFFSAQGPQGVAKVLASGAKLFLDLKFHDIPNTVAGAMRAAAALGPFMLNVHASGGRAMMEAAVAAAAEGAAKARKPKPLVLAVTVLTSLGDEDLSSVGQHGSTADQVKRLAVLAQKSGVDGVVCSAREVAALRSECGPDFKLVVPGIRPTWSAVQDQKRIMGPADAIRQGADYLVVGRPITGAPDPRAAARSIAQEIAKGADKGAGA
ncbi:MAG TPA: orotidine-5'-phosphate decarboxylase [Hypericibacter adhaerens]|jgi:orotidine-5'-phosphate decarboxylase|nr:orotidine-5'-phosphate decarboxylase [Hypericibacter adhaerens]HWA41808.1 orotidine-5'-phosphate decarboxylase [Hypericibacter adhaerens]